jgi:CRISPR-associated protein Csd1
MILQALYQYYQRCADLAPEGFEDKEIPFLILIDANGAFVGWEDTRSTHKGEKGKIFCVIRNRHKSGTGTPIPNILWDDTKFVLGYSSKEDDRLFSKHELFKKEVDELARKYPNNVSFNAVAKFYKNNQIESAINSIDWNKVKAEGDPYISFRLIGESNIIAEEDDLNDYILNDDRAEVDKNLPVCLITGKKEKTVLTHAKIKMGTKTQTALVAFQTDSGYDSFGHSQGMNAPISQSAEFAYTTALNRLLGKGSKNKFLVGSRTFLFWASSDSEAAKEAEAELFGMFGYSNDDNDDPNRRIEQVRKVFLAIYSGSLRTDLNDRFYILGLAPNVARIAVVYWEECPLKEFARQILKHFDDMEIADTRPNKKPYYGLHSILSAVALQGKTSNVSPNLPEAVIKSILQDIPYPYALLMACINRIRAEQEVTIARAAIIKAYLNRLIDNNKTIEIMIDKENQNQGYVCGRLFATLEYLQERSNGIHSVRDRYMNAASATPSTVFPTLLNLSVHHAEKLEKGGQIYFEQLKSEIISKISPDGFPTHLDLQDQGRFFVGYYHQRQEFYTKKSESQEPTD